MFRLIKTLMAIEDDIEDDVCEMCGTVYDNCDDKEECYQSCVAEVDDEVFG